MVKNLPAVQETRVRLLGWEDLLEKGMATHSSILPGEFRGQRVLWATVHGVTRSHHLLYSSKSNFANSPKNVLMSFHFLLFCFFIAESNHRLYIALY